MKGKERKIRAIFFDLDDTIIDTCELLVDRGFESSISEAIKEGLKGFTPEELKRILKEKSRALPPVDAVRDLCKDLGLSEGGEIYNAFIRGYFSPDLDGIRLGAGIYDMMMRLGRGRLLFLVTSGIPAVQKRKVEILNLLPLFERVEFVDVMNREGKMERMKRLMEEYGLESGECLVIGDRVKGEIKDGKRLGMWTIRIKRGEFASVEPESDVETPHCSLSHLLEAEEIIETFERTGKIG